VPFAEDEKMVQHFVLRALHPSLGVGIHVRGASRDRAKLHIVAFQNGTEFRREFSVPITNDMCRLCPSLLVEKHRQITGLLGHPNAIRIRRHARNVNATRFDMDKEQNIIFNRPSQRPNRLGEEVGRPKGFDMAFDKFRREAPNDALCTTVNVLEIGLQNDFRAALTAQVERSSSLVKLFSPYATANDRLFVSITIVLLIFEAVRVLRPLPATAVDEFYDFCLRKATIRKPHLIDLALEIAAAIRSTSTAYRPRAGKIEGFHLAEVNFSGRD
jgi:hypothetical protein